MSRLSRSFQLVLAVFSRVCSIRVYFSSFFFVFTTVLAFGQSSTFTSNVATGNWDVSGSWVEVGSDVDNIPDGDDIVIILNGHNITVIDPRAAQSITINSGGTLTVSSSFTAAGMTVNGTYVHNINGGSIPTGIWSAASTLSIQGITTTSPTNLNQSFGNFVWNCLNQSANIYMESNLSVQGNFTVLRTGPLPTDPTNRALRMSNTSNGYSISVGGNFVVTDGAFKMNNNTGSCSISIAGNLQISTSNSNFTIVTGAANSTVTVGGNVAVTAGSLVMHEDGAAVTSTLNVAGNFTHSGGLIDESGGGVSSIVFNGAGVQNFASGGTVLNAVDFVVNSGSTLQMSNAATVVSGGGSFTLSPGATLWINSIAGITTGASGHIQVSGARSFSSTASYVYNGSMNQSTGNALPGTVANLTVNNSGTVGNNTVTLTQPTNVSGTLNVATGILATGGQNLAAGALTMTGTAISGSGTFTLNGDATISASANSAFISCPLTISAIRTFAVADGSASPDLAVSGNLAGLGGGLVKNGGGALTLSGVNTFSGGFTLATGTLNLNSSMAVGTGALIISGGSIDNTSGGPITLTSNNPQTWNSNLTFIGSNPLNLGTGAVSFSSDRQVTVSGSTLTVGGTISTSSSLTKLGSGSLVFGSNPITINNLTISAGSLTATSGVLSIAGNFTNGATFLNNSGTVRYNGASPQSVAAVPYHNLTFSGAGQKNATGTLNVAATLDNQATAVLDMGINTLSASVLNNAGTIRFSGPSNGIAAAGGTVVYNGSNQTIAAGSYNNLTVSQVSGNATIAGDLSVAGTLTLTNGRVVTGPNTLSLTATANPIAGANNARFISGTMAWTLPVGANPNRRFEIGSAVYAPATLIAPNVTGAVTIAGSVRQGSVPGENTPLANSSGINQALKVDHYWGFIKTGAGSFSTNVSFDFTNTSNAGTTSSYRLRKFDAAPVYWTAVPAVVVGNSISSTGGITSFSDFQVGELNAGPTITTQPASGTVCEGASVTLTIAATGSPAVAYQWRKNGVDISGATAAAFTILSTSISDAADYVCVVSNINGVVTSAVAALAVDNAPVITVQPNAATICENTNTSFGVTATGTAVLTYQWEFSTDGGLTYSTLLADAVHTNVTTATLSLTAAPLSFNGRLYRVRVTGGGTCTSRVVNSNGAVLNINAAPVGTSDTVAPVCSQLLLTINPQLKISNGVSSNFSWTRGTLPSGLTVLFGNASGSGNITGTFRNTSNGVLNVDYTVTPTSVTGGCAGVSFIITIPVQSEPVGNNATAAAICSDQPVNYNLQTNVNTLPGNSQVSTFSWVATDNGSVTGESLSAQNGAILNDVLVNVSGVDQVVTYTVTPTGTNGCVGSDFTVSVTVRSKPTFTSVADTPSVCSNILFTIDPQVRNNNPTTMTGNTFAWTGSYAVGLTGGAGTGTGDITETLVNTTATTLTVTYTITPTGSNGCVGQAFTITKDITPQPNGLSSVEVAQCSNVSFTFNPQNNVNAGNGLVSTFSWTRSLPAGLTQVVGGGGTGTGVIAETLRNLTGGVLNAVYTVTPSSGGCTGSPFTITVPVNAEPVVSTTLDRTVCSDVQAGISLNTNGTSVSAATYNLIAIIPDIPFDATWVAGSSNATVGSGRSSAALLNDVFTNTGASNRFITYRVAPVSSAGCQGAVQDIVLTVRPEPVLSSSLNQTICSDQATGITLATTGSSIAAATYTITSITVASGLTPAVGNAVVGIGLNDLAIFNDSFNNRTAGPLNVQYNITPVSGFACSGNSLTVTVTVNPEPVGIAKVLNAVCGATAIGSAGLIELLSSSTASNNFTISASAVGLTQTGGPPSSGTGFTSTALQDDIWSNTGTVSANVIYTITPISTGGLCAGDSFEITVPIAPQPSFTFTNIATSICSGSSSSVTLSSTVTGAQIRLKSVSYGAVSGSYTAGAVFNSGQSLSEVLVNNTNNPISVTYVFEAIVGGCLPSAEQITAVLVNPNPSFTITNATPEICSGTPVDILFNSSTAGHQINVVSLSYGGVTGGTVTGTSTFTNGNRIIDALVNTTNAPIDVVYTFNVTTPSTTPLCPLVPVNQTTTVRVLPAPQFTFTNSVGQLCSGTSTDILLNTPVTGGRVRLVSVNYGAASGSLSAGTLYTNGQRIQEALVNNTNSPVTVSYTFEAVVATCAPSVQQTTSVIVNPNPSFTLTNATPEICSGTPADILFNSTTAGHQINVVSLSYGGVTGGTVTGTSTFTNGNKIIDALVNTTNAPIDVVYTFNVTTPSTTPLCPLVPVNQTTTVRVLPAPQFTLTNSVGQLCSGTSTDILLNTPVTGGRVRLVSVNYGAASGSLSAGTLYTNGQRIQEALVNNTNSPVTVSYTFEAVVATCAPSVQQTTSVLVNPNPSFTVTNASPEICSGTPVDILLNSTTAGHQINVVSLSYGGVTGGTVTGTSTFTNGNRIIDALVNTTNAPIDVVYTFNVTTPSTTPLCPLVPVSQTTTVRVLPAPQFTLTNSVGQLCSGTSTDILLNTPVTGGRVRLVSVNYGAASGSLAAGVLFTDGQRIQETIPNNTNSPVTVSYTFEAVVGTCSPSVPETTTVLVSPNPQFTLVNTNSIICSNTPTDILFSSSTAGHQVNVVSVTYGPVTGGTVVAGTTTFSNGSRFTETLVNNTSSPQDVTYVFNVTTPGTTPSCPLLPVNQTAVVRVNPIPVVGFTGATTICSNSISDIQLNNPNSVSGTTYTWSVASTNVTGASAGAGSRINQLLSSTDGNTPGSVTYTVVPTANGCSGSVLSIAMVINPIPTLATSLPTQDLCNGQTSTITLSNPNSVAGVGYVWTVATTGISGVSDQFTPTAAGAFNVPISLLSVNVAGAANYVVQAVANNCFSSAANVGLTIRPLPTLGVPANAVLCEPTSILLPGTVGQSADRGLWSVVIGAGSLSATNIVTGSPIQVNASYDVDPADIGMTVVMRLTTSDPDGPTGLCAAAFADYSIAINRSARLTAGPDITICADVPSTPLQGSVAFAPNGVAWSLVTGAGTFSNPTSANSNYSFSNPTEINQTVSLRLTGFDPDGSGPCTNVFDEMNFRVNPLPVVSFVGLPPGAPPQVAENIAPFPLTGNQVGGLFTVSPITSNIGATVPSPTDRAFFDPSNVDLGSNLITYTFTNANGCTSSTTQELIVNPVTQVDFAIQNATLNSLGQFELCAEQGQIKLLGFPAASTGFPPETQFKSVPAFAGGPTATIVFNGTDYFIDTNGLSSNTYRIQYDYKNAFGGITFKIRDIIVFASPVATFTSLNNCIASDVVFNDASTINPTPFATNIVSWFWTFGDPGDISSVQNPSKRFVTPGTKNITLRVTTLQGCSDTSPIFPLRVGAVPEPDFESSAFCNNDETVFRDRTRKVFPADPTALSTISEFTWNFGDGSVMTGTANTNVPTGTHGGATSGTFNDPLHQYATFGTYNVSQTVRTNDGCVNTVVKRIFILPYTTVRPVADSAYYQDFNTTNGGWVTEAFASRISPTQFVLSPGYIPSDTSWIWSVPAGATIRGTDRAWWTGNNSNQYYPNENSVVNGPCFDLRQLQRPMVTMDVWTDAERNIDGAVLQYSSDGGLTWRIVGPAESLFGPDRDQGINWFNGTFITSNPGNQSIGQFGWTNATQNSRQNRWLNARFNLDMIPPIERGQVRLRLAFASNDKNAADAVGTRFDGFAFDNVYVGNKKRQVLVEHFTNFTSTPTQAILDASGYLNNLYQDQITFRQGNSDFTDIQYHMELPGRDALNQENPADPASRALFMNVSQPPTSIMDGIINNQFNGLTTRLNRVELDRRALRDPLFRLQLEEIPTTDNNRISVRVTVTADSAVNNFPMIVQVALLEDGIGSGRATFRRFLLTPGGQIINGAWVRNQQRIVVRDTAAIDVPIKDPNRLRLVAFIQNRTTREILQVASIAAAPKQGRLVVGLQESEITELLQTVSVYPNPAKGTFYLSVPNELTQGSWKLLDQRGVAVRTGSFADAKNGVVQVDVRDLPESIYIVALIGPANQYIYKKLMLLRDR